MKNNIDLQTPVVASVESPAAAMAAGYNDGADPDTSGQDAAAAVARTLAQAAWTAAAPLK